MTKFMEILRLQQQGLSQRQIVASLRISRNTIKEFFRRLESSDPSLPLNEHLSKQRFIHPIDHNLPHRV